MAMTHPFRSGYRDHQTLNDSGIRLGAPPSNVLVRDEQTGKKLRIEDPHSSIIRYYKGGKVNEMRSLRLSDV